VTIAELFERHAVVALDSNVLIYLLEGEGPLADAAQAVVDGLDDGPSTGVLATIGLTEVLSGPAATGDGALFERLADELLSLPGMRLVPLDREIAVDAARDRSAGRHLGDAVHVATARRAGATCIVTNDARLRGRSDVEVVLLSTVVPTDSVVTSPNT
jgi:predicted nucleic acid-binding protein